MLSKSRFPIICAGKGNLSGHGADYGYSYRCVLESWFSRENCSFRFQVAKPNNYSMLVFGCHPPIYATLADLPSDLACDKRVAAAMFKLLLRPKIGSVDLGFSGGERPPHISAIEIAPRDVRFFVLNLI